MKKLYLPLILISLVGLSAFGKTGEQEELDFLLFLPNSGNRFVNEDRALIQLDTMAKYLMGRNLSPGQISVYGYAAAAANDIEPVNLSMDRALYVINELQKRGLSGDLFVEPVACGSVDLWGGNTNEGDRRGNRRVRIMLDDTILMPAALQSVDTGEKTPKAIPYETARIKTGPQFPWWIIPLALMGTTFIVAIILFASGYMGSVTVIPAATPTAAPAMPPGEKIYVLMEAEISRYAHDLYRQRIGRNGETPEDWYRSIRELTAHYEAQGYRVIPLYRGMPALAA